MYSLLLRLIVLAALMELGISLADFENCHSRQCIFLLEKRSRNILKIEWKPISVFPEEAKQFREKGRGR